jgi:hypothetical protein
LSRSSIEQNSLKMRLLFATALLLTLASVMAGGKEWQEMMKWTKMKALENCVGEDNIKISLIKMKRAASKCSGEDAPELDLPMFEHPFKLISTLTKSSKGSGAGLEKLMSGLLRMQVLKQFLGDDDGSSRMFTKRSVDDNVLELNIGERLTEKLMSKKMMIESKMSNMTCMMQECGYLNAQEKFDGKLLKKAWKDSGMDIKDKWLEAKLWEGCDNCIKFAENIPQELADTCVWGPEMYRVKMFHKCMMKTKIQCCMKKDIKDKLEKNFGSIEELTESTGLKEDHLFMVVKELLKGPEEMMM